MPVNTARQDYDDMLPKWKRLRDCTGGRDALIKAGTDYVPDLPGNEATVNASYRKRGNFFNATKRTIQGMTGAVFQTAPKVEQFPENIKEYLDDITLTNVNFEMFASEAGRELMTVARYGVLIDMPAAPDVPVPNAPSPRPYCIGYKAEDIINWRTQRRGGDEILTMVILCETVEVPNVKDSFVNDLVKQYRVIELKNDICQVSLWREVADKTKGFLQFGEVVTPQRRGQPLTFIPFVILGATHATPDLEEPLLIDLADVNLGHWRNSVDHEWGLHLVALPTPWVAGVKSSSPGTPMKMGPGVVWELDTAGQAGMLEFSGAGLASLVTSMDKKEKQMAVLGARLLEDQAQVQETASAVRMRHADEHANLRTVAGAIESGLTLVLEVFTWWVGTEDMPVDTPVEVELNKEYLNVKATAQEIQVALTALQAGEISFETWWYLLTTGGWGREGIDAATERDTINKQKSLAPEPALDPTLSPEDPPATPAKPKQKTIAGPDGQVKYTITEN